MKAFVKIADKKELKKRENDCYIGWNKKMSKLIGKVIDVEKYPHECAYRSHHDEQSDSWIWHEDWLDFSTTGIEYLKEL